MRPHRRLGCQCHAPTLVATLLGVAAILHGGVALAEDGFPLNSKTTIRFASAEQGRRFLSRSDAFLQSLSLFDREIRVRAPGATLQQLLDAMHDDVVDWKADDQARFLEILESLRPKLARLDIPWPADIWLVRTRGEMEGGAAYCRQEAVVMPELMDRRGTEFLEMLLTHELFHVVSNQNPELRQKLYQIVGFEPMRPLELPAPLADRKITNPDAPLIDCFLWVVDEGQVRAAAPVLLSRAPYHPDGPQSPFALLEFHLLSLEPSAATGAAESELPAFEARWDDGKPRLLSPDRACLFWNIGINTNYIIHPEEVLADNFTHLIHGRSDLPTPRIVDALGSMFGRE